MLLQSDSQLMICSSTLEQSGHRGTKVCTGQFVHMGLAGTAHDVLTPFTFLHWGSITMTRVAQSMLCALTCVPRLTATFA